MAKEAGSRSLFFCNPERVSQWYSHLISGVLSVNRTCRLAGAQGLVGVATVAGVFDCPVDLADAVMEAGAPQEL